MIWMREPPKGKRPDIYCLSCKRRMSPGRSGRRLYCSNACRQAAYRKRQGAVTLIIERHREAIR